MVILDVHLTPGLALWITSTLHVECFSAKFLGLTQAQDSQIFDFARIHDAIVITKDDDFVSLLSRKGAPPKVIWLTCGNTSRQRLTEIFNDNLAKALELLQSSDLVEITGS
jgi:predicted nuclease of predicted toxin-antitoxin system